MVSDTWWDLESRRNIECTDDDQSQPVTYGRASKLGKSARRSMAPSLADELRAPETRRPRRHAVDEGTERDRPRRPRRRCGDVVRGNRRRRLVRHVARLLRRSSASGELVPRRAIRSKTTSARSGRCAIRASRIATRTRVSANGPGSRGPDCSRTRSRGATDSRDDKVALWRASPFSDAYLGRMAVDLVDAFKLGARDATDFLGVGFSATDTVGHPVRPGQPRARGHRRPAGRRAWGADQASRRQGRTPAIRPRAVRGPRRVGRSGDPRRQPGRVRRRARTHRRHPDHPVRPGAGQHALRGRGERLSSDSRTASSIGFGRTRHS